MLALSLAADIRLLYPDTSSLILSAIESASALRLIVTGLSVTSESSSAYDLLIVTRLFMEERSSSFMLNFEGYCATRSSPRVLINAALADTSVLSLFWLGSILNITGEEPLIPVASDSMFMAVLPRLSSLIVAVSPMFDLFISLASLFCMLFKVSLLSTLNWNS